jgi:hypothetical protein
MLINILLSSISHSITAVPKTPSPAFLQSLMLLMLGGTAFLNKKQFKKATRKMKWQLLKEVVKNSFKSSSSKSKRTRRIILFLVLGGLLIWWLYTLIGPLSLLFLILLVVGFASSKNI